MSTLRRIFDPAVVAQPCRAGCRLHVHGEALPSQGDYRPAEDVVPFGWTSQSVYRGNEQLFMCNGCNDEVWESEVATHVCQRGVG